RWLIAAADAAASQMPTVPNTSGCSGTMPGTARNMPMIAVNTISATTRGLVRERDWLRIGGGMAVSVAVEGDVRKEIFGSRKPVAGSRESRAMHRPQDVGALSGYRLPATRPRLFFTPTH